MLKIRILVFQGFHDRFFEGFKRGIIATMEALGFDEFPKSLNEIQVGRGSRQPQEREERDMEAFRLRHDMMMALVPRMVEHDGDGMIVESSGPFLEEFNDTGTINVGFLRDGDDLMGYRVESS